MIVIVLVAPAVPTFGIQHVVDGKSWLVTNQATIGAILAPAFAVSQLICQHLRPPKFWNCVAGILDSFQKDVFRDIGDGEMSENHRVTLYRYYKWCVFTGWRTDSTWRAPWGKGNWPWSGWLVPVVRAGPDSRATTIYLAKDAGHFEGVCGAAFFAQAAYMEKSATVLPDITPDAEEKDIANYAKETFISPEIVKKRIARGRPCAKAFLAMRVDVQYKQGAKWGVLMIDSRADSIPSPTVTGHRFRQIRDVLGHLLRNL